MSQRGRRPLSLLYRVVEVSCNGGDWCVGKVLRVQARRHQPALLVVEAQSTLRS
jgi:hypothetical protein